MLRLLSAVMTFLALAWAPVHAQVPVPKPAEGQAVATFAGGCFWCVESDFDKVDGVLATTSGFMGGTTPNPTYKTVTAGGTGHLEVVQIIYDPKRVSYERLLDVFWRNIDPYDPIGQFCDKGDSYLSGIFTHDEAQKTAADASLKKVAEGNKTGKPIATTIRAASTFTPAEEYHQDYYKKNPIQYRIYRTGCGRDARLESIWGKSKTQ